MALKNSTQNFIPIKEIRDSTVVMDDGSLRAVLMVSSINFALQSDDIQEAVIMQFQNFFNSLDFSIQIFLESRRLDIKPYLSLLEQKYKEQTNDLLKIQTREYINFIHDFTENTNIMRKRFFVIVPFSPAVFGQKKGGGLKQFIPKKQQPENSEGDFNEQKFQLEQRMMVVEQGLQRCGLRVARLGTEELVEMYYKLFNPGEDTEANVQNSKKINV